MHHCQVDPQQVTLVGVSGGPDSLCLLDGLWRLGCRLVVAHLDHGLRPESQQEAAGVAEAVTARGLPFRLERMDVAAFASQHGLAIEEAARLARYRFLFAQAAADGAQAVAVGHTADDQVETVLMHLLRGSGLAGLRGMDYRSLPNAWSESIALVRPLLGVWRAEVLAYLAGQALQPNLDPSNQDTRFFRNRLRHELIPYLESYNPQVRTALWRTAAVLREDYAVLEAEVEKSWQACVTAVGPGWVSFAAAALAGQPLGMLRMLLRRAIAGLRPGLRDVDFAALERAVHLVQAGPPGGGCDLIAGLHLQREGERLWLAAWEAELPHSDAAGQPWPQIPPGEALPVQVPGITPLPGGWELHIDRVDVDPNVREHARTNLDPYQAWVDADALQAAAGDGLQVRSRRPGDRFQPLGLDRGSQKLSDFMINIRLPQRARKGWPLLLAGESLVWLPGLRLAHPFRLTESTRQAIHFELRYRGGD